MFMDEHAAVTPRGPTPRLSPESLEATSTAHRTIVIERGGRRAAPTQPAFGQALGQCILTDVIGRGGWCTVYRAVHKGRRATVAIKLLNLHPDEAHFDLAREQLQREAHLLAQIQHPHVVRFLDFHDDPALPYLVLECVEGPSLRELIQQSGRLHCGRARTLLAQVGEGLVALGSQGIVHRDIKPANILLTRDGSVRIADLGQAVVVTPGRPLSRAAHGEVAGTVAYVAPEQFLAPANVDERADLYSLGATFYEAVTGRVPFSGRSRMEILLKHTRETPVPPKHLAPAVDPALSELIMRLLAKDPNERPASAAALCDELAGEPVALPSCPAPRVKPPTAPAAVRRRPSWYQAFRRWFMPVRAAASRDGLWLHAMRRTLFGASQVKASTSNEVAGR